MTKLDVNISMKLNSFDLKMKFETGKGCLGILGPSGCGKSMTLKSIAGIVHPDCGTITLAYEDKEHVLFDSTQNVNLSPQKRCVGYLFQDYALFPNMSVEQNILVGLKNHKILKERQREILMAMIAMFHLQGLEKRYPLQLSGGQQQRVALARILAYKPDVLLFDEPFSAMDTFLREGLRLELIKVLKAYDGISVLVTHDRDEAYQLCNQLVLLNEGKVIRQGETKQVFAHPGTPIAARLTGCKNISKIERLGAHKVKAYDWGGIELTTEGEVTERIAYIGIRAHDFLPCESLETENSFEVGYAEVSEMPFEWYITTNNGIWWKREKYPGSDMDKNLIPQYLRVSPGSILLLEEENWLS